MSRKANPTIIGSFVVGAVILAVFGVAVFGGGRFLVSRPRAVAYFHGNIQGLSVGSAVNLRGVQVGTVTDIQLRLDLKDMRPLIPVYLEFDRDRFHLLGDVKEADLTHQGPLKAAIANGLHARLATQSLVTGQLVVNLDLDPKEPRHLVGADPNTVEIPTSRSDVEKLKEALMQLPLDQLANSALKLLEDADRLVTSDDASKLLRNLALASDGLDRLLSAVHDDLPAVVGEVSKTGQSSRDALAAAQSAMLEMQTALRSANELLATDGRRAIRQAIEALSGAEKVLETAETIIAANSPQRYDIDQALRNLSAATRSLRIFAEGLERRPNSVIVGK